MLTTVSRLIGFTVSIVLMAVGANTILDKITMWKQAHDQRR